MLDANAEADFVNAEASLIAAWAALRNRVQPDRPVALVRHGSDLLVGIALPLPGGKQKILRALIAPPHSDRTLPILQLSIGWLQLALTAVEQEQGARAARLLDLLAQVLSQDNARAAAQDWINRTASWARTEVPELSLSLFSVVQGSPSWWVSSDTAWAEKGAPELRDASEVAAQSLTEMRELEAGTAWALPLLDAGEPKAVLVARAGAAPLPEAAKRVLRASAAAAEPTLRRWNRAERPLWRHGLDALLESMRKVFTPGHLAWKFGLAGLLLLVIALTLVPVEDRVTANLVIEGRVRQTLTAPFEGFVAEVFARPGDSVKKGARLAQLDTRDLLLEQGKYRSARDQAAGKLRQAMGEREAAASQQAAAELREAEAQLALVEAKLERSALTAPLDGMVVTGDWAQQIGSPVETGKEMFELAALEGYRVVLQVADRDISKVHAGQEGRLRLTGRPDESHTFKVKTVTAVASVKDGENGFRVEAEWEADMPALNPGMQGVGKIVVGEASLLRIWTKPLLAWARLKLWSLWW